MFDREAPVGRFVTGDRYVVKPVTVVAIDPKPLLGDAARTDEDRDRADGKYARNGSVLNLPYEGRGPDIGACELGAAKESIGCRIGE